MNTRPALALLALALPLLTLQTAQAAPAEMCLQHPMQTLPGVERQLPQAMSPAGRFVVGNGYRSGVGNTLIRWHDGVVSEVGVTDPNELSAADVSDDGQIVFNQYGGRSFRYRDGATEALPAPSGYGPTGASRIDNAHGVVIGLVYNVEQTLGWAIAWDATNRPRILTIPAGFTESSARDIADDGTIVGAVSDWSPETGQHRQHAALWRPDGTVVLLPKTPAASKSQAESITDGVVEGYEDNTPVRWQLPDQVPTPITTRWPIVDTNPKGTILYNDSVDQPGVGNRLLEPKNDEPGHWTQPVGVTIDDQVLGWDEWNQQAVRWDCSMP